MQELSKYHLRRKDFAKIKAWYEFTNQNFIPTEEQFPDGQQNEKKKQCYFRLYFNEILLSQLYVNSNMRQMMKIKQVFLLSSLFNKERGCIVSNGREIIVQCQFDVNNIMLKLKQEIALFFYTQAGQTKYYELCFEIHTISQEGQLLKFGACRFPLLQRKDSSKENTLAIFNNLFVDRNQQLQLQTLSQVQNNKKEKKGSELLQIGRVGRIEFELDTEEIKDIKKYLPPLRILDSNSKLPPTTLNLKKKKQQLTLQPTYRVLLQDLLFKINKPAFFRQQLLDNNPFTFSHKDYLDLQIKEFSILVDNHNGYKFIRHKKNQLPLELVAQNQEEVYVSSKKIHNLELNYFDADLMVLVIILSCRVEFRLRGVTEQKRTSQFMVGWLPIPLELGNKQNRIEMMMVNDIEFPTSMVSILGVPSQLQATFVHSQYQKYKQKKDQKKIYTQHLISDTIRMSTSTQYLKLRSQRNVTDSLSSQTQNKHQEAMEAKIRAAKSLIRQRQAQKERQKYLKVNGRAEVGQTRRQNTSMLPMESTVGKYLKVKLQIDTFIAETNSPSIFYLPRKMKATLHFFRQTCQMAVNIIDREVRFHVPTRLNPQKSTFYFNSYVSSLEQFQAIMSSRFVITFYEEDAERCYAKGITSAHDILGAVEADQYAYVSVLKWTESGYKIMGRLLVNVGLEVVKNNRSAVQEMNLNKMLYKMPLEERMKMRIGCYKGDEAMKNQAVAYVKRRQHSKYVQSVVLDQLRCDGQLQYEVGKDVYYLLPFINDNNSEINTFTFHLNCPYAQLVTDQQEYRQKVQSLNLEQLGYQRLHLVLQQPRYLSYYETKLRFNQQLGLLVRLNVNDYSDKGPVLENLQIVVKRNTMDVKKYLLKCKYLQPMIYDVIFDCAVDLGEGTVTVQLPAELTANYTHITCLDKNVSYKSKNKQITISNPRKHMKLLMSVHSIAGQQTKTLIYQLLVVPGQKLSLATGEPFRIILPLQEKTPVQILSCSQAEVTITNIAKFSMRQYHSEQDVVLQPLRPFSLKNFIVCYYDLSGVRLGEYLLQVESQLPFLSQKLEIAYDQSSSYSVAMNNPYACACSFRVLSSSRGVILQEEQIAMEGYGSKVLIFELSGWVWDEKNIYLFLLDEMGKACYVVEICCKIPKIRLEQEEHTD